MNRATEVTKLSDEGTTFEQVMTHTIVLFHLFCGLLFLVAYALWGVGREAWREAGL
jgi:hypothetical protein